MSYSNKIQFWTEQLADAKVNNQSRYSVARCEESLAYFTARQDTLLARRADAVAESLTESRNKLIAEFMGYEVKHHKCYSPKYNDGTIAPMQFHTSWDWLMPVVERIESHTDNKGDAYRFTIDMCNTHIEGTGIETIGASKKFDAVYQSVVEFIKEYNKQTPSPNSITKSQNDDFFFTDAHYDVMADAISLIEEKIVKDYLSYSHNDAMTDTVSQALFEATWKAVRKVIKDNA